MATSGRPMVVDDQAALRLHDDLAHRLRGGLGVVLLAADHLEVVQPREEGGEEREHQRLDDDQAQPAAGRPWPRRPAGVVGGHQAVRAGSSRVNIRHHQRQHERREQHVPAARRPGSPRAAPGRPATGSPQHQAAEREDRGADERRAATVATTAVGGGPGVLAHPARRRSRRRRGRAPSGRRRGRPAGRGRARPRRRSRAPPRTAGRGPARRRRRRAGRGWARCPPRRGAGRPTTCSTSGHDDRERRPRRARSGAHRRLPSASITARSLGVPDGTTTPTRSRDAEVDERVDHRALGGLAQAGVDAGDACRPGRRRRTARRPRCPR